MGCSMNLKAWKTNKPLVPVTNSDWIFPRVCVNHLCPGSQLCEDGPAGRIWEALSSWAFEISQLNDFIQLGSEEKDSSVIRNKIHPKRFPFYLLDISAILPAGTSGFGLNIECYFKILLQSQEAAPDGPTASSLKCHCATQYVHCSCFRNLAEARCGHCATSIFLSPCTELESVTLKIVGSCQRLIQKEWKSCDPLASSRSITPNEQTGKTRMPWRGKTRDGVGGEFSILDSSVVLWILKVGEMRGRRVWPWGNDLSFFSSIHGGQNVPGPSGIAHNSGDGDLETFFHTKSYLFSLNKIISWWNLILIGAIPT